MIIDGVEVGPNCDLSHRSLDDHDFSGLDLRYSDFHGSSLRNTNFRNSVLYGVNFVSTALSGADFSSSKLVDPAVPFTNLELSEYLQEGMDLAVHERDQRRMENGPDQVGNVTGHPDRGITQFDEDVDALFTSSKLFRWPASRHYRSQETSRIPRWFSWDNMWDFFLVVPGDVHEEGYSFFEKLEWQTFERNWVRSFVLHNAAACFDQCAYDDTTCWATADEIRNYPYFNMPPQLKWAEIDATYRDDPTQYAVTAKEDCDICSGWYAAASS